MNGKHPMFLSLLLTAVGMLFISTFIFARPTGTIVRTDVRSEQNSNTPKAENTTTKTNTATTKDTATTKGTTKKSTSSEPTPTRKEPSKRDPVVVSDDSVSSELTQSRPIFDDFVDPDESSMPASSTDSSSSETVSSSQNSSLPTSSENVSSEISSTPPDESTDSTSSQGDDTAEDFSIAIERMHELSRKYFVDITMNFSVENVHDNETFTKESDVLTLLDQLDKVLSSADSRIFRTLSVFNLPLEFYLVPLNTVSVAGIETIIADDGVQMILQQNPKNPNYYFNHGVSRAFDEIIWRSGELKSVYSEYQKLNPKGFKYGVIHEEYLNSALSDNCYFLSSTAFLSIEQDRADLFALHSTNSIPEKYLAKNCPIMSKCDAICSEFEKFLTVGANAR